MYSTVGSMFYSSIRVIDREKHVGCSEVSPGYPDICRSCSPNSATWQFYLTWEPGGYDLDCFVVWPDGSLSFPPD